MSCPYSQIAAAQKAAVNAMPMSGVATAHFLFVSISNLFDAQVIADRTETLDYLGAPRTLWAGFRVSY